MKVSRVICVCFCLSLGCAEQEKPEQLEVLPVEQVPEKVMKAAAQRLPDVRFDSAWKAKKHGREVYEVRGKTAAGKVYEVEVSPDGEVIAVE